MPKKKWTEEERKAFGEKMKASREAKLAQQTETEQPSFQNTPEVTISQAELDELKRQIEELKNLPWQILGQMQQQPADPTKASIEGGKLTGTFEKYPTTASLYPDPTERLSQEPKLQRFAFPLNYELKYTVGESTYTTIDGIRVREPKFTLELIRIVMDEETGEPTNGRYVICQFIMHEDPETALVIARQMGLNISTEDEASFLNEMRYIRMRDWLLECFYPPTPAPEKQRRDMVINGRLVQYWEVNSEKSSSIDFGQLPKIKF